MPGPVYRTLEEAENYDHDPGEPRSFDPPRKAAASADGGAPGDAPEVLKRATDGDEQKSRPLE